MKNAVAAPANACKTISSQTRAVRESKRAAVAAWIPMRVISAVSITPRRGRRSAKTPPTSRRITSGAVFAAITKPRSRADPVRSSTAHASANSVTASQGQLGRVPAACLMGR